MQFIPFDPSTATDADYVAVTEMRARMHAVDKPGASPIPLAATVDLLSTGDGMALGPRTFWTARDDEGVLVGLAWVMLSEHENTDTAFLSLEVELDRRRQGIGTAFLRALLPSLRESGRTRLLVHSLTCESDGEPFAIAMGLTCSMRGVVQQLDVDSVDSELWDAPVPDGYRLDGWTVAAPEELIASYAEARKAIEDAPSQDLEWEETAWTPQRIREEEAAVVASGQSVPIVVAIHEDSGEIAGLTEVIIRPGEPHIARQCDTAVRVEHRGHGLGRALKGEMMRRLLADRPGLKQVTTQTATDNASMIGVNHSLGYVDLRTTAHYTTTLDDLVARLEK